MNRSSTRVLALSPTDGFCEVTEEKAFQKHRTQIHRKPGALFTMTNDEKVYARKG
jgi:hypothetical protein